MKNEKGFSYIEVMISMAIFAICIVPISSMLFNASKNGIKGRRSYEAVIMAQNLLEEVKKEIEIKLVNDDPDDHNDPLGTLGNVENIDSLLEDYHPLVDSSFYEFFKGDKYQYEIYIKKTDGSQTDYQLMNDRSDLYNYVYIDGGSTTTLPEDAEGLPVVTEFNLTTSNPRYFDSSFSSALPLNRIMSIQYDGRDWIIPSNTTNITLAPPDDSENPSSFDIVIDNDPELFPEDRIELDLDVSKLPDSYELDIRVENLTKADVIFTIYRSNTNLDKNIELFPIQRDSDGNIFIERKTRMLPQGNYIIRIIVRDRKTSKILKDMIDIYAHDYRTATY